MALETRSPAGCARAILLGAFVPSQRLLEEDLASAFEVSRGPVRDTLVQLQREGLVTLRRNCGASVARLSQKDVEEVYSLRLALERLTVQRVAQKAHPEDLAALEAMLGEIAAAIGRNVSEQEFAELDLRFHDLLYRAAHHERLYHSWVNLRPQIHLFLRSRKFFRERTVDMHRAILEALKARDEKSTVAVIEEHLASAYLRVMESYRNDDRAAGASKRGRQDPFI